MYKGGEGLSINKGTDKSQIMRYVGNTKQLFGINRVEYLNGNSNLTKALLVNNGSGLEFSVNENKCLDIFEMKYKGINLGFQSAPGLNSPYLADNRGEFYTYSQGCGFFYTAGLGNVGAGEINSTDSQYYHGMIKNMAAENISVNSTWKSDKHQLAISGDIRESSFFGRNLVLSRQITTNVGENTVNIQDNIENQDFKSDDIMLLYHINLGFPLIDKDCEVIIPAKNIEPLTDYSKEKIKDYDKLSEPIDGEDECVYAVEMKQDNAHNTMCMVHNQKLGIAVLIKYNTLVLPYLIVWKSMKSGDYAYGMLPANTKPIGRTQAVSKGEVTTLSSFERMNIELEIEVLDDTKVISSYIEKINNLI